MPIRPCYFILACILLACSKDDTTVSPATAATIDTNVPAVYKKYMAPPASPATEPISSLKAKAYPTTKVPTTPRPIPYFKAIPGRPLAA